jgi:Ca2+-binding EF-hand superfamily protein
MPIFVGAMLAGRYGAGRRRCGRVELTDREKRVWKQQIEDRTYIDGVLSTYDVSHSGGLTYDELKTFLGELGERGVGLAEKIREPTDGEIKWILQTVFEGEWREADQQVTGNQICKAAMHYLSYMRHYDVLERVFDKYDTDKSGFLSKDQLTSVLTDLDEGTQPPEGVVDEVMHRASKVREEELSKPGFLQAISSWYGNLGLALKRIEAQQRKQELAAYVKATWQRYDVSKSGGLTYEELRKFLKDLHKEIASVEIEVTEAEVRFSCLQSSGWDIALFHFDTFDTELDFLKPLACAQMPLRAQLKE